MAIICSVNDLSYFSPPTTTSRRDYFQPLHVDCSVEYELPNCAKPPLNAGVRSEPLLMIHPSYYRREEARHHEAFVNNLPPSTSPLKRSDMIHFGTSNRPKDCHYDGRSFRTPKGTRKRPLQPSLDNPKIDLTTRLENYDFFGGGAIGSNRTDSNSKLWTKTNTTKSTVPPLCCQTSHPATPASIVDTPSNNGGEWNTNRIYYDSSRLLGQKPIRIEQARMGCVETPISLPRHVSDQPQLATKAPSFIRCDMRYVNTWNGADTQFATSFSSEIVPKSNTSMVNGYLPSDCQTIESSPSKKIKSSVSDENNVAFHRWVTDANSVGQLNQYVGDLQPNKCCKMCRYQESTGQGQSMYWNYGRCCRTTVNGTNTNATSHIMRLFQV